MKFLVTNYSCLQNPWLRVYRSQIPVISVLCPQLNLLNPPRKKFLGTPLLQVILSAWTMLCALQTDLCCAQETVCGNFKWLTRNTKACEVWNYYFPYFVSFWRRCMSSLTSSWTWRRVGRQRKRTTCCLHLQGRTYIFWKKAVIINLTFFLFLRASSKWVKAFLDRETHLVPAGCFVTK